MSYSVLVIMDKSHEAILKRTRAGVTWREQPKGGEPGLAEVTVQGNLRVWRGRQGRPPAFYDVSTEKVVLQLRAVKFAAYAWYDQYRRGKPAIYEVIGGGMTPKVKPRPTELR